MARINANVAARNANVGAAQGVAGGSFTAARARAKSARTASGTAEKDSLPAASRTRTSRSGAARNAATIARTTGESRGGVRCSACDREERSRGRALTSEDLAFLSAAARSAPSGLARFGCAARPGGALEALLRGGVETFAERRFGAYRHLAAAEAPGAGEGAKT